jgi:hypothetical protein
MEPQSSLATRRPAVRKAKAKKSNLHTADFKIEQPSPLRMPPLGQPLPQHQNQIQSVETRLSPEYLAELALNEAPVSIRLPKPEGKFPAPYKDVTCGGIGIEVLINNKWHQWKAIPFDKIIVTKWKYVEILLLNKQDTVTTRNFKDLDGDNNDVMHNVSRTCQIEFITPPGLTKWQEEKARRLCSVDN